jgi:YVTN family beta-propeller protein
VKVRMGLHTGEPQVGEERYVGLGVHKAARIGAAGHGGQVLLSRTTRELAEEDLPPGVTVRDLGDRRLKDVDYPERLSQLVIEGLPSQFAPLKTLDIELRRKRRRMYARAAFFGVLAAAVAIPVFALGQGSGGGVNVEANSVAVIDPGSNKVIGSAPVGIAPEAVAAGADSVWAANTADQTVSRIDARTRRVVRTIAVGEYPGDLALTPGSVWVALGAVPEVRRIAIERDEADEALPAAPPFLPGTTGQLCGRSAAWLAAGGGALWFACGNDVDTSDASRIDVRAAKAMRIEEALVSSSPFAVCSVMSRSASARPGSRTAERTPSHRSRRCRCTRCGRCR